jgi:hypothetical protein
MTVTVLKIRLGLKYDEFDCFRKIPVSVNQKILFICIVQNSSGRAGRVRAGRVRAGRVRAGRVRAALVHVVQGRAGKCVRAGRGIFRFIFVMHFSPLSTYCYK